MTDIACPRCEYTAKNHNAVSRHFNSDHEVNFGASGSAYSHWHTVNALRDAALAGHADDEGWVVGNDIVCQTPLDRSAVRDSLRQLATAGVLTERDNIRFIEECGPVEDPEYRLVVYLTPNYDSNKRIYHLNPDCENLVRSKHDTRERTIGELPATSEDWRPCRHPDCAGDGSPLAGEMDTKLCPYCEDSVKQLSTHIPDCEEVGGPALRGEAE